MALQSFGGLGYLSLAPKQWKLRTSRALGSPPSQRDPPARPVCQMQTSRDPRETGAIRCETPEAGVSLSRRN